MRTIFEYDTTKKLLSRGYNHCKISRETGIPRPTIRDWINKGFQPKTDYRDTRILTTPSDYLIGKEREYSYILGQYLGDGHIIQSKNKRSYKLRIFNDVRYEDLCKEMIDKLKIIFPACNPAIYYPVTSKVAIVTLYSNILLELFPQHGKGKKSNREIKLKDWQTKIVNEYPQEFLRGLFMSDGCRFISDNRVYYNFTNTSKDISDMLRQYLTKCNIGYTITKKKPANINYKIQYITNVARREEVSKLEEFVGKKS